MRLLILLALLPMVATAAEPGLDESRARAALQAFTDAVGTDPGADYSEVIPRLFSPAMRERDAGRLPQMLSMLANDGFGELMAVNSARFDEDRGMWVFGVVNADGVDATVYLAITEGGRVDSFGIRMGEPVDVPRVAEAALAETIRNWMAENAADFSGSVIVANGSEPVYTLAKGIADEASGRKMTLDTPMNLGSVNKMFTGVAIAQLVEAGKLDWSDTVGRFLPDYPNEIVRNDVTIAQLLNHTAGVPSYWNDAYMNNRKSIDSQQEFLDTINREPLEFEPGTQWSYSNGGPVILGRIIEKISGMSYYDCIRRNIYQPLGMKHSDHYRRDASNRRFATGYVRNDDAWQPNDDWLGVIGSAAGGGYASATDLLRFSLALQEGRLLDAQTLERMWRETEIDGEPTGYGYLVGTERFHGQRRIGHSGGAPGVSAMFHFFPRAGNEAGYTVIVLSNRDHGAVKIARYLDELVAKAIGERETAGTS